MTETGEKRDGLESTGERLVPDEQHGELVHAEHLVRYHLAAQLAHGRRVLDAACGEGYGTALLAAAGARSVVGVDIDEATVAHARGRHGVDGRRADVASLPFDDGAFDLVVSFETIEHVPKPDVVLDEFKRVLAEDGLLIISTPNVHEYLVDNEFHEVKLTHEEFVALLRERFPDVRVVFQHNWTVSAILEEGDFRQADPAHTLEIELRKTVGGSPGGELYTVALCGRRADAALRQVAVAAGTDEAHELARRTVDAEQTAGMWHDEWEKAKGVAEQWHDVAEQWRDSYLESEQQARRMAHTFSWRATRPLRVLGRLLRGRGR